MDDDFARKVGRFLEEANVVLTAIFMLIGLVVFLFGLYLW